MKRFFRLAIAAIWFTAPVISLLFMRNGSSNAGSYPFSAMFTCLYELLHFATDTEFVTIVLGMTVFWIALGAASLLVDRFSAMKILLLIGATAELLFALASGASFGTIVLTRSSSRWCTSSGKNRIKPLLDYDRNHGCTCRRPKNPVTES